MPSPFPRSSPAMPLDAMPYADLAERHGFIPADHAAPRFFPVECLRLFDEKGVELEGYRRITRTDTGKTLHVVSDRYKLVSNEEAFTAFEEALRKSGLNLDGMRIGTDFAAGGARVFRQYLLPAHDVEVKPGVRVALRLLMFNSYDGSLAFTGRAGAYNFVCANTSISGKDMASFRKRHTDTLDVGKAVEALATAARKHIDQVERWRAWPAIRVSDAQALDVFKALPQATKPVVDHLARRWLEVRDTDAVQGGPNLWALFNVLTAWATHDVEGENRAQGRAEREERVARLVNGETWGELVPAGA